MKEANAFRRGVLAVAAILVVASPLPAQSGDQDLRDEIAALKAGQAEIQRQIRLEAEIEELKKGQAEIQKQLEELKALIQARPAARAAQAAPAGPQVKDVVFDLGDNPIRGSQAAQLTLVEFTDYQCPFCARHVRDTQPKIEEEYIQTGKLRYASLDLPLENIHKLAFKAAEATHCAEEQGKFWEMHDRLFEKQKSLEPWNLHAVALDMDADRFEACLDSGKYADAVRKDMEQAQKAGATGTPSFVLAKTDPNDPAKVTGIAFIRGARPFDAFKSEIDRALGDSVE